MKILSVSTDHLYGEILDLAETCHKEEDVRPTLNILAKKVAAMMQTDVCSIYLIEPQSKEVVLVATHGLNVDAVGKIRMSIGEGLVGKTVEWIKPVSVAKGSSSKSFKYFPGSGEEKYASFLSVPLVDKRRAIGAVVIQNEKATRFSARSAQLLMTLMTPVAKIIERVKLVNSVGRLDPDSTQNTLADASKIYLSGTRRHGIVLKGIAASPGIAIGKLYCVKDKVSPSAKPSAVPEIFDLAKEKEKVAKAMVTVRSEMQRARQKAEQHLGEEEIAIFQAYDVVLENEFLLKEITAEVETGQTAIEAIELVIGRYASRMAEAEDPYLKERSYDIEDIGHKLVDCIVHEGVGTTLRFNSISGPHLLYSNYWSISDLVELDPVHVKGVLSGLGGASSHVAILAESMGIPAVLGLGHMAEKLYNNHDAIMDGSSGMLILDPDDTTLAMYKEESRLLEQEEATYRLMAHRPAVFKDGGRVVVGANLGMLAHLKSSLEMGAEEIGLYRTEFPFLIRKTLPTEEEQISIYKRVVEGMQGRPICIRVLDLGGDKEIPYLNFPKESNPFLGWRSVRIFKEREDLFRIQLRAIFKSSTKGKVRLLIPMISSLHEVQWVKEVIQDVRSELKKEGVSCKPMPLGIMIEVPSAAEMADQLIRHVDFFSIGTNDLTQYLLAVDRNNPKVAPLYNYLHPAVLRCVRKTVVAAVKNGKDVSVCGEMAGEVPGVIALLSLGVEKVSMNAPQISKIKSLICQLSKKELCKMGSRFLQMESPEEVKFEIEKFMHKKQLGEYLPHVAVNY